MTEISSGLKGFLIDSRMKPERWIYKLRTFTERNSRVRRGMATRLGGHGPARRAAVDAQGGGVRSTGRVLR